MPLADVRAGDSMTEFVAGSHKVNLVAGEGVDSREKLAAWAEQRRAEGRVHSVALKAGSICVFHGLTVHRGRAAEAAVSASSSTVAASDATDAAARMRPMIYGVFKKNWYDDEPSLSYNEV